MTKQVKPQQQDYKPVTDHILHWLIRAILSGDFPLGAKLSEPEIARHLGVSRAPLREAIRRLEERHLVTSAPRLGARVVVLSAERIQQIFTVREAMEGMAARQAALNITAAELEALRQQLECQRTRSEKIGSVAYLTQELKDDFHLSIAHASRNLFLIKFLSEGYGALIELCRRHLRYVPERAQRAWVEHARIVGALEDRDPDLAELTMRRHISAVRASLHGLDQRSVKRRKASIAHPEFPDAIFS